MFSLADAIVNITGDDAPLGRVLGQAKQRTTAWASEVGTQVARFAGAAVVGGVVAVTTGIIGIGVAAFDAASQVDTATKSIETKLSSLQTEAHDFGSIVRTVYGNNFGGSIEDVGQAIVDVSQQMDRMGTMTDEQLTRATERALSLRDAFGIDVAESTNAVNALMQNFGLTADEAFTMVQAGLQNGLNNSGDFLDTIGEYSNLFAEGGASAEEFFSLMSTGLQAGVLGTDKAADLFKEFSIRIADGSSSTAEALQALGMDTDAVMEGLASGSMTAADMFRFVQLAIENSDDPLVAMQAGVALMGSQFEDLGMTAVTQIDLMSMSMDDIAASTSDLNTQYDNLGGVLEGMKRKAQMALVPIGDVLLNLANQIMPLVTAAFGWFETTIVPAIERGAEILQQFIGAFTGGLADGMTPLEAFRAALAQIVPADVLAKFDEVVAVVGEFIGKVQEFVGAHSEELKGALLAIGAALAAAGIVAGILGIVGALGALLNPITLVIGIVAALGAAWAGNWGGIQDKTRAVLGWLQENITRILNGIRDFWTEHGDKIKAIAQTAWEGVQRAIDTVLGIIQELWAAWTAAREGDWTAFGEHLREAIDRAWEAIRTVFVTAKDRLLEVVGNLIEDAKNAFTGTDWGALGRTIIEGLVSGLDALGGRIADRLRQIAQDAWDAWTGFWDSNSPSRLAMQGAADITAGMVLQFDRDERNVVGAVNDLAAAVAGGLFGGTPGAVGAGGGDVIHLTIDARGAAPGVGDEIEAGVLRGLRAAGRRADNLIRTRG